MTYFRANSVQRLILQTLEFLGLNAHNFICTLSFQFRKFCMTSPH